MADYKLVPGNDPDRWDVEITSGNYNGVVITVNNLGFEEKGDECVMSIDYDVINDKGITFNEDWNVELGDTCQELIKDSLKHTQAKQELAKREV